MILNPFKRMRLEFHSTLKHRSDLRRWKDPATGIFYVGCSPWDPFLRSSVLNQVVES